MKKLLFTLTALTLAWSGCKKEEARSEAPVPAEAAKEKEAAAPTPKPAPDENADHVRILAGHAKPKPGDPVVVSLTRFQVVQASFDPAKVEGGTATIELDLTSLESGSAKRDKHLRSDDYLDVDNHARATIAIDNVKKTGDNAYAADAMVKVRGTEKKFPVAFTVLETLPDGIRIRGEHTFSRHDLQIGHAEGEEDSVARDLTIQLQLTLKKT